MYYFSYTYTFTFFNRLFFSILKYLFILSFYFMKWELKISFFNSYYIILHYISIFMKIARLITLIYKQ